MKKVGGKKIWNLWANALGSKTGKTNKEADWVAIFRTLIVLQAVICNLFIVINILMAWGWL
tara:strand:- start:155 stop:337 length:183 start_codon:yes stop_codon:yes gene_type:complete